MVSEGLQGLRSLFLPPPGARPGHLCTRGYESGNSRARVGCSILLGLQAEVSIASSPEASGAG